MYALINAHAVGVALTTTAFIVQVAVRYATETAGLVKVVQHTGSTRAASSSTVSYTGPEHVRSLIHLFFECFKYPALLLVDDTMEFTADFYGYFAASQWLLGSDPSLYCISGWNDLEKVTRLASHKAMYR